MICVCNSRRCGFSMRRTERNFWKMPISKRVLTCGGWLPGFGPDSNVINEIVTTPAPTEKLINKLFCSSE